MNGEALPLSRLSRIQAAWVIARRDFLAILFSRAFLFFLLGPLFPVAVGSLAGNIGGQVEAVARSNTVAVAMAPADAARMLAAADTLGPHLAASIPTLATVASRDPRGILSAEGKAYALVVSGTPAAPLLTGPPGEIDRFRGGLALVAAQASGAAQVTFAPVAEQALRESTAAARTDRIRTAQAGQLLLFLLTMLLAGMVLSNLVEEKANKIIEVLAAAIPMDAVFLGKLVAMLAVSFVGIAVWATVAGAFLMLSGSGGGALPAPAVGWPLFLAMSIAYFALAYLLLGALFLTIGALASTVREVQTLSMPVTMMQLMVFFLAAYALTVPGSPVELAAVVFPLSSPFAMLARAALSEAVWPHLLALAWQAMWVVLVVRGGAALFRRRVMKSGAPRAVTRRKGFGSLRTVDSRAG